MIVLCGVGSSVVAGVEREGAAEMAISVHDKDLLKQAQNTQGTIELVLDELQKLNAVATEVKDLLAKIHDCLCNEVTGIGVEIEPPTPH